MTIVTPQALVSTAILLEQKRGITSEQLLKNIEILRSYLEFMGLALTNTLKSDPERSIKEVINQFTSQKILEAHNDFDPVYYSISEEKRANLNFQKNSIIHFFLPLSYVSSSLINLFKAGKVTFSIGEVEGKIGFLKDLSSFAFAASGGLLENDIIAKTIEFLHKHRIAELDITGEMITITTLGAEKLKIYGLLIKHMIDSYSVALYTCSRLKIGETIERKNLIKEMLKNGEHLFMLGRITYPESTSKPAFEEAIGLFKSKGYLEKVLSDKDSQDKIRYKWVSSEEDMENLQQELELFV